jgi:hypothetical protein
VRHRELENATIEQPALVDPGRRPIQPSKCPNGFSGGRSFPDRIESRAGRELFPSKTNYLKSARFLPPYEQSSKTFSFKFPTSPNRSQIGPALLYLPGQALQR